MALHSDHISPDILLAASRVSFSGVEYRPNARRQDESAAKLKLLYLVEQSWYYAATEPKDKIYGLMGLVDISRSHALFVNNTHSVAEMYARATVHVMQETRSTKPLQLAAGTKVSQRTAWLVVSVRAAMLPSPCS